MSSATAAAAAQGERVLAAVGLLAVTIERAFSSPDLLIAYALVQTALFLLLVRSLDLYEREPFPAILLCFAWGAIGAAGLAVLGNNVIEGSLSDDVGTVFGASISAPPVEETAKGIALVAAFAISGWAGKRFGFFEFDGVTDGIVYGAAIGLGFAFTEDIYYMMNALVSAGDLRGGNEIFSLRRDFLGLNSLGHALMTATFGVGLGLATWSRSIRGRLGFPLVGLAGAMLIHALHNGAAEGYIVAQYGWDTTVSWARGDLAFTPFGEEIENTYDRASIAVDVLHYTFLGALILAGALWLRHQRRVLRDELEPEVASGLIGREQLELMPCYRKRAWHYAKLLRAGQLSYCRHRMRLDHELAEYAFLSWRVRTRGADPNKLAARREVVERLVESIQVDARMADEAAQSRAP